MRRHALLAVLWPAVVLADEPSVQPALDAVRRRDEHFKTVSVRWTVVTFIPKGGRMEMDLIGQPLPREDQTVESTHFLILDGDRFRAEHQDPGTQLRVPGANDYVVAFDGERQYLRHYVNGRMRPAQLVAGRPKGAEYEGDATVRPVILWCREKAWDRLAAAPPPARAVTRDAVDGSPCLAIRLAGPRKGETNTYLVAVDRDFLVRRLRSESGGFVEVTDIEYRDRPTAGWTPSGWTTVTTRPGGKLASRSRAEVTDVRLNEPVPPETFRLDPRPGETFTDDEVRKTYRVRDDGGLEELDPFGGAGRGDRPGARPDVAWPGRSLVRFVLLPGLAVALLGGLILRRRRRQPHTPSP